MNYLDIFIDYSIIQDNIFYFVSTVFNLFIVFDEQMVLSKSRRPIPCKRDFNLQSHVFVACAILDEKRKMKKKNTLIFKDRSNPTTKIG